MLGGKRGVGWYRKIANQGRTQGDLSAPVAGLFNLGLNFYLVAFISVSGLLGGVLIPRNGSAW
jgi:hypothetical protein